MAVDHEARLASLADVGSTASGWAEEEGAGWVAMVTAARFPLARLGHMAAPSRQGSQAMSFTGWLCILLELNGVCLSPSGLL